MKMNSLIMILLLILTLTAEASNQEKGNNGFGNICEKNNPCENGGICGYTRGGYICKCQKGWEGDDCSEKSPIIDEKEIQLSGYKKGYADMAETFCLGIFNSQDCFECTPKSHAECKPPNCKWKSTPHSSNHFYCGTH
ncbi:neurogenic locus notch homolog protein 1-like [Crassostrea angulata]|uniref:neurogenic locus notch homolog protein 1-like n=1 Tax=Magallana angulata TaxID=2784310 RepID=UPI0022B1AB42|nr:neurogenic locus notch homolog protein 1-like [Crassostrea angulata]